MVVSTIFNKKSKNISNLDTGVITTYSLYMIIAILILIFIIRFRRLDDDIKLLYFKAPRVKNLEYYIYIDLSVYIRRSARNFAGKLYKY